MKEDSSAKLQKTAKELLECPIIQELSYHYSIEIFPDRDELILRIQLRDFDGKLTDAFGIPANSEGFVNPEAVLEFIVVAFEMGLEYEIWQAAWKRLRKNKF